VTGVIPNSSRILVADDVELCRIAVTRLLTVRGYGGIDVAVNGLEALRMTRRNNYRLIFMDCHMPELDGYAATTAIRALPSSPPHTMIVAMTADMSHEARQACLAAGMDDVIAKPVRAAHIDDLLARSFLAGHVAAGRAAGAGGAGDPEKHPERQVAGSVDHHSQVIDVPLVGEILADGGHEAGLLDLFVVRTRARLADLAHAVTSGDADEAARIVHSLKGSSATFGATELANAAARLSEASGHHLLTAAAASAAELRRSFARTELAFAAVVAGLGEKSPHSAG
jgi:two-component system, sensor histidine kinase and response regulator